MNAKPWQRIAIGMAAIGAIAVLVCVMIKIVTTLVGSIYTEPSGFIAMFGLMVSMGVWILHAVVLLLALPVLAYFLAMMQYGTSKLFYIGSFIIAAFSLLSLYAIYIICASLGLFTDIYAVTRDAEGTSLSGDDVTLLFLVVGAVMLGVSMLCAMVYRRIVHGRNDEIAPVPLSARGAL